MKKTNINVKINVINPSVFQKFNLSKNLPPFNALYLLISLSKCLVLGFKTP